MFGAYLSGIETDFPPRANGIHDHRLEPTYQGLKRFRKLALAYRISSLEPTYQGLKLLTPFSMQYLHNSLEPTYQGLKLIRDA